MVPKNLRYSPTHEWASLAGDVCTVGISKFAVEQLTDLVYVDFKPVGTKVSAEGEVGQVESVKAVSSIYAPVPGEIVAINDKLTKDPVDVTTDPYGAGWMIKLKVAPGTSLDTLLSAEQYEAQIGGH